MCERERWSNNRKTKDRGLLRQHIQRDVINRDIKDRVWNTILMDNWSKPVLSPLKNII